MILTLELIIHDALFILIMNL